ncbi:HAD family hydrolase [Leptospira idonii]|uniref:phosphoglycolate phosphatase n=1 Tax=Leptospira idonii TaxID=1193500 RepID=A0A4V3JXX9_9LEPT|nr:HAD-IA family hydrolase [Leptospira idonii]TGN19146.1 HAD family hydrolase [Leptospira idonii]
MNFSEIKAIVFDYDDTIVQTKEIRSITLKRLAKEEYHFTLSDLEIQNAWGLPGEEFLLKIYGDYAKDVASLWEKYNNYCSQDKNLPYPGAEEFINGLTDKYPLGILTSSSQIRVFKEIDLLGFPKDRFFTIQTSDDTSVHKPDPNVFSPLLEKAKEMGIPREKIIYIGDSLHDQTSSKGAGLEFLGMAHEPSAAEKFSQKNIPFVTSFRELGNLFP